MKIKWIYITFVVIIILLAVFFILQANSMWLTLSSKGLETAEVIYIEKPYVDGGCKFAVIQTYTKDGALALVHAKKNAWGFWVLESVKTDDTCVELAWLKVADSSSRTDYRMSSDGRREWHFVCCGNDAIGNIKFTSSQLPENVTVSVRQTGQEYTVHVISFSDEGLGAFSIRQTLIDNGFAPEV